MATCATCGQESPEGFRFCGNCGAALRAPAERREERKVLTVLYADVVGSTARADGSDPEDVRAVLAPYHARVRAELERFGGTVEKFIGDAVVALFGAPAVHEDDAERAVRAALAVQDAIAEMNEERPGLELQVRVGIATGEALVALDADPHSGEGIAAGDVMNTGARLQSAAPVGGVLVGEATYRATRHVIDYEPLAPVAAKGKAEPLLAWRALQPRSRLGIDVRQHGAAPLVGRRRELDVVLSALERARAEHETQLVTLVGVPGIGKSRLVWETLQAVEADPEIIFWRQGRCLPYGDGVTFWAVGEMVKAHAGMLDSDSPADAESKLRRAVDELLADEAPQLLPHLGPLVGLTGDAAALGQQAAEAFAAWRRFFEAVAEQRPLVLVFEDLHWADDGLLDFVDHLADWARGVSLLLLCTARPELLERRPHWGGGKLNAATVALAPLSEEETGELVAALGSERLDPEARAAVLARAAGNPLYAEQFVRMVADRGDDAASLPETVQGIIAARLDVLPPAEKELLQRAAVVGKVFWSGAVAALDETGGVDLELPLHGLERKELVRRERRSSVGGETEYAFRHALLRDVAYGQIPRALRAELHRRAALWIEALGRAEDLAELRAHHWLNAVDYARQAGLDASALERRARDALLEAAARSLALHTPEAARRWFAQAFELWPEDGSPERLLARYRDATAFGGFAGDVDLEELRDALLAADLVGHAAVIETGVGWTAWNEGRAEDGAAGLERALSLVAPLPPSQEKLRVLDLVARRHIVDVEPEPGVERAREVLALADALGSEPARIEALNTLGVCKIYGGDETGFDDLGEAIRRAEEAGSVAVIRALKNAGSLRITRGELEEGFHLQERAMRAAERFGDGYEVLWSVGERALERWSRGRFDDALADADRLVAAVEAGQPHYMENAARRVRALVSLARDDLDAAGREGAAVLALGRGQGGQVLPAALIAQMRVRVAMGEHDEAGRLADEFLALPFVDWQAVPAPPFVALGRSADLLATPPQPFVTAWEDAGRAYLRGEYVDAARRFAEIGSLPEEAETRLRAGGRLVAAGRSADGRAQVERALAFWRSVGAVRYVREAEALLQTA